MSGKYENKLYGPSQQIHFHFSLGDLRTFSENGKLGQNSKLGRSCDKIIREILRQRLLLCI